MIKRIWGNFAYVNDPTHWPGTVRPTVIQEVRQAERVFYEELESQGLSNFGPKDDPYIKQAYTGRFYEYQDKASVLEMLEREDDFTGLVQHRNLRVLPKRGELGPYTKVFIPTAHNNTYVGTL